MMATMAMNLPDPDDRDRTTLIVVPAALLQQVRPRFPYPFLPLPNDISHQVEG